VIATTDGKRPLEFIQVHISSAIPLSPFLLTLFPLQDSERLLSENLEILVKLKRLDELTLHFKGQVMGSTNGQTDVKPPLTGLTFIHTATQKDAKRLLTRDFNADPNVWSVLQGGCTDICCSFRSRRMLRMWEIIRLDRLLNGLGHGPRSRIPNPLDLLVTVPSVAYLPLYLPY